MKDFKTYLQEGVYDPGIFKAFFLAGGPGSGKSFVGSATFGGTGLKLVNSDVHFERTLKKMGYDLKMPDSEAYFRDIIRNRSKAVAGTQLDSYIKGRLGLVMDATGRDYDLVARQKALLQTLGYDCYMIFVNSSLDVALERNKTRQRVVPELITIKSWKGVQANIGKYQRLFGASNFTIIDNNDSEKELVTLTLRQASSVVRRQMNTRPMNQMALNWIRKQMEVKRKMNEENDQVIIESIIDIPRKTYSKKVFDDADTDNPKLKKVVLNMIRKQLDEFELIAPVLKHSLIGSILTKRYRDDADLDINVLFKVPVKDREVMRKTIAKQLKDINGKLVPGSKHPINYYVITDPKIKTQNDSMADGIFDIESNSWVRKPEGQTFEPEKYERGFQDRVKNIDVVKGELARDLIDYTELKGLGKDEAESLQALIGKKFNEIEDSINTLVKMGDETWKQRQDAFNSDITPDEIRQYGQKHKLPKNIIYKYLEKYHYMKFWKVLKDIVEDEKITDDEIDRLNKLANNSGLNEWQMWPYQGWMTDIKRLTTHRGRIKAGIEFYKKIKGTTKDAANRAAQVVGIDYKEFGDALKAAGLRLESLMEAPTKSIAFTFGRFNPPTIGHEKLINKVASVRANDYRIIISKSEDPRKNPLSAREKLGFMKQIFPRHASKIEINNTNMILDIVTKLYNKGYRNATMVVGSDRVREFDTILNKYNDIRKAHGYYNFDSLNVVSAGERDPDEVGAIGMSASKMRDAAEKGDLQTFKKGLPRQYRDAEKLFKAVRGGMNLREAGSPGLYLGLGITPMANTQTDGGAEADLNTDKKKKDKKKKVKMEDFEQKQLRDLYIREQIFNINDKAKNVSLNIEGIVKRRGTNYVVLEDNESNLHKSWIWDCIPISADKEVAVREHNLDVDYGFKAVSEEQKTKQEKKVFNRFKKDLSEKVFRNFPESYDVGHDYAQHTLKVTPGQDGYDPNYQGGAYVPSKTGTSGDQVVTKKSIDGYVTQKDIEEWALSDSTIYKYKERYGEEWENKLKEVKEKMLSKTQ
tara:strand:- start:2011 stop:5121 length:3111 start_codon:yes stop_codon:yes gene_type:complete